MPYLPSDAAKKSQLYSNIINGDTREYQEEINDLKTNNKYQHLWTQIHLYEMKTEY